MRGLLQKGVYCKAAFALATAFMLLVCLTLPALVLAAVPSWEASSEAGTFGAVAAGGEKHTIRIRVVRPQRREKMQQTSSHSSSAQGYTETQIREQMQQRYAAAAALYRRASGVAAEADYTPGTLDVKIPAYFFPVGTIKNVTERFRVNPDGTLSPLAEDMLKNDNPQDAEGNIKTSVPVPQQPAEPVKKTPQYKDITIQLSVPAASPFRVPQAGDFFWFDNDKGSYIVPLLAAFSQDPLKNLPAQGPMLIRYRSPHEILAVTADDPEDDYYYKNADTLPTFGKAVPVYTETRKTAFGRAAEIRYIRYFRDGVYCLAVRGDITDGERRYGVEAVFPESRQYDYLPQVLYVIENLKGRR